MEELRDALPRDGGGRAARHYALPLETDVHIMIRKNLREKEREREERRKLTTSS